MRNTLFKSPSPRQIDIALLIIRAVTGFIFIAHGWQKLFVYGFAGVTGAFAHMGVPAPEVLGPLVALVEFFGGIALVIGLLTRLAALGLAFNMLVAMLLVHLKGGFFNPGGIEFPLSLFAAALVLVFTGAGNFSSDRAVARR
ncbi:MAG TPA: DoxX family protein [Gemmatimonadaceae bacterium]